MEHSQPPIRIICPGRVYRNEAISYRAHAFFHQVEALYIDKNVSFTDLRQVLLLFAKEMFGEDTQIRLRPSYFPFTEPSAEMDISCNIAAEKVVRSVKAQAGWKFWDVVWWIRMYWKPTALTAKFTQAMR